ncbi:hypothetical protein [Vibrio sp. D431a]|uniref:hypothetical protein n=1 Tax=Vibrio sp. D431a TaxID=2837388 RepID=UPI002556C450|nr:hypothetical protein [Vibrio sp. D431a]MDK9789865.1 hypothetical protein [Vibrio sp. D431a]
MTLKTNSSRAKFKISLDTGLKDYYNHFKKAKDDDTLDIMYEGLNKQLAATDWDESTKNRVSNDIYIAYGKRQEDFDGIGGDSMNVQSKRVEAIEKESPSMSAEDKLGAALRALHQS